MNSVSYVLLFLIAAAVGFGIYKTVKRKGRCACCDGTCPGCREASRGNTCASSGSVREDNKEATKKDGEKK